MTEIERLQQTIKDLHDCQSEHVESVPVREVFQGQPVWEGTVEVFRLLDHPQGKQAYAWSYKTDAGKKQYVAVLGVPPVNSAQDAVRAYIVAQAEK
jgi:hypothetical protein